MQSVGQVAGVLWAILWALEEKGLDMLGFLSIFIGSVSIVAGELGFYHMILHPCLLFFMTLHPFDLSSLTDRCHLLCLKVVGGVM